VTKAPRMPIETRSTQGVARRYAQLVAYLDRSVSANNETTRTYNALRAFLLPRLLWGDLRIADADHSLEAGATS